MRGGGDASHIDCDEPPFRVAILSLALAHEMIYLDDLAEMVKASAFGLLLMLRGFDCIVDSVAHHHPYDEFTSTAAFKVAFTIDEVGAGSPATYSGSFISSDSARRLHLLGSGFCAR